MTDPPTGEGETMSQECVVAVYDTIAKAQRAVQSLHDTAFPGDQISLVSQSLGNHPQAARDLQIGDDSVQDAAIGAGLGGAVGLLAGLAFVAASSVGVFLLGPLAATGAIAGAFLGGLAGWGVHDRQIRQYERLVHGGKVLLVAHGDPLELVGAEHLLAESGSIELHVHATSDEEAHEVRPSA